jgi:hypothetical protein
MVSEGRHELGTGSDEGALLVLIRRLLGEGHEYNGLKVSNTSLRVHHGKGAGFFKKAVRCLIYAQEHGYDVVILVVDEDGDTSRRRQLADAQEYQHVPLKRAFGLAIQTFDAWMLADEQAISRALGCPIPRQPDPESLRDSKSTFLELHQRASVSSPVSWAYAEVARNVDLECLASRCPDGFGLFTARMRTCQT